MMKKNELIEALNQGGYIYMDDQGRRAIVYSMTDERLDSCRYDTAENLARQGGYDVVDLGAWSFARRIEKTEVRQAARQAAAEELASIRTPGHIELRAKNDCWIGSARVTKGRRYSIWVFGNGVHQEPRCCSQNLYDFDYAEHAVYFEILSRPEAAEEEPAPAAQEPKQYARADGTEATRSASEALGWHRAGHDIIVAAPGKTAVYIHGVTHKTASAYREDDNRARCKHIAHELEAYVNGEVYRCPECGEILRLPENVGDKYRCPHCCEVNEVDDLEQLGVYDFLEDVYDIEYRCDGRRNYRSVQIMVACGGPNIYLDTASGDVELYWWSDRARYPMSRDAVAALDEWAEEYWNC
jgi:predicted RNA-binding Zn-ribbon protein involved in translation (DUF1610 family)